MAASSNISRSKSLKTKLDSLGCPYTEGVEDSWITELLFKPGEARIRLLQWLFSKCDSTLNDILDPQYASVESKMDSRIQRLLYVASTLGLCRYDDVDLIRGVTSASKQAAFMEHLIDLVCIADAAEDPQNKLLQEPGLVCDAMSLDEQLLHDAAYLNNLGTRCNIEAVFKSSVNFLPPDLQKTVEDNWSQKGHQRDKPPRPDLQSIADSALKLAEDMERQKELLEDLKKHYRYQPQDVSHQDAVCRLMSLVLSELSQLITGFTFCYENEMHHWCNKSPPALTQLGPTFKRVHRLLQQFIELFKSLKTIRSSYTSLGRDASERIGEVVNSQDVRDKIVIDGDATLTSLQDVVDVLEESIQHKEPSSTQTTPRSIRSRASTLKGGEH